MRYVTKSAQTDLRFHQSKYHDSLSMAYVLLHGIRCSYQCCSNACARLKAVTQQLVLQRKLGP